MKATFSEAPETSFTQKIDFLKEITNAKIRKYITVINVTIYKESESLINWILSWFIWMK